jgi:hypothetical protein
VTVLKLELAPEVARGETSVRRIPESLTTMRPLPAQGSPTVTGERRVPTLATPAGEPDFVPASVLESTRSSNHPGASDLLPLLDVHTKGKARGAPIAIFVLCIFAVVLYLALR